MSDDRNLIIIKKVNKGDHGHHGGAWKIAYADFVTAMMAFFLLLWLLNATTEEQKLGIAVQAVQDIDLYDEDRLQEAGPGVFPEQLLPYLGGYFVDAGPVIDTRTLEHLPLS